MDLKRLPVVLLAFLHPFELSERTFQDWPFCFSGLQRNKDKKLYNNSNIQKVAFSSTITVVKQKPKEIKSQSQSAYSKMFVQPIRTRCNEWNCWKAREKVSEEVNSGKHATVKTREKVWQVQNVWKSQLTLDLHPVHWVQKSIQSSDWITSTANQ